jgi:hypothetical protein
MKRTFLLALIIASFSSCAFTSLTSGTQIGPKKEFELGDGKHGAFKASVKNSGTTTVEVFEQPLGGEQKKLATLAPGDKTSVRFKANTKAIFKNLDNNPASLALKVTGDTGLSMGGPNY